jgi:hypothetical protein
MKIKSKFVMMLGAGALALAANTAAVAATLVYTFNPGTSFDFGGGNSYDATGGFTYDTVLGQVTVVNYTAVQTGTGPTGPFIFTAATTVSPTIVNFTGDCCGDENEFTFAQSLATGGNIAITGFRYRSDLVLPVTGSATAAVPEPASWAMLLVGFGGMGLAMRARRKSMVAKIAA